MFKKRGTEFMKKRIDLLILPIVAFAAIAGTGFGAWYFVTNNTTATAGANFEITAAKSVGDFTVATSGKIILDQTAAMTAGVGDANRPALVVTNGDVSTTGSYDGVASNNGTSYSYSYSSGTALDTKVYYTISCTIGGGLETYVSLTGITNTTDAYKVTIDGSKVSATLYPQFAWTAAKPETKAAYDTMVTNCAEGTIVFTVTLDTAATNPNA
jgi:hypothetical protein